MNDNKYVTMLRTSGTVLCLCGRHVVHCTDHSRVRVCPILVIDTSKAHRWLFDSTLSTTEQKAMFTSHFHQPKKASVIFFIILAMDDNIICNLCHTITEVMYVVHHVLEDVFCTGQTPGEADKMVSSPWCVESCQQG